MRITIGRLALILAVALAAPSISLAEQGVGDAVQMPGDMGTENADIRINRGSGFADIEVPEPVRGVVRDASRPVTVSDTRASRVGRPVSSHRWGAAGRSVLRTTNEVYIIRDRHFRKRPHRRHHDKVHRRHKNAPHYHATRRHGRDLGQGLVLRGKGGAFYAKANGTVGVRLGF